MSKRRYEDYENVSADVIRKAYKGDNEAMSRIIAHYQNYGRKCFGTIASTVFDLDVRYIPMDDLMQLVWIKFVGVIRDKFDVSRE